MLLSGSLATSSCQGWPPDRRRTKRERKKLRHRVIVIVAHWNLNILTERHFSFFLFGCLCRLGAYGRRV